MKLCRQLVLGSLLVGLVAVPALADSGTAPRKVHLQSRIEGLQLALWNLPPQADGEGSGRVVLVLHPASFSTMTGAGYEIEGVSWMGDLAATGYDVWGLDLLGYGAADRYPEMSEAAEDHEPLGRASEVVADVGRAVDYIRRETGVGRLSLIGQSWGATVAGHYAEEAADRIDRLVLYAAFGQRDGDGSSPRPTGSFVEMEPSRRMQLFHRQVPEGAAPALAGQVLDHWSQAWLAEDPDGADRSPATVRQPAGWRLDLYDAWNGRHYLDPGRITVPTLVVRGEWDTVSSLDDALWIFGRLATPSKRLVIVGRGTHVLPLEKERGQLYREVRSFLGESESEHRRAVEVLARQRHAATSEPAIARAPVPQPSERAETSAAETTPVAVVEPSTVRPPTAVPELAGTHSEPNVRYRITRATSAIQVDSVLDEPAWEDALAIPLAREWAPGNNVAPQVDTECLVTFDENNLYVAFRAYDPEPGKIRARLADRDLALADDTVGFLIDTFNEQREAFEFRVNPLGVQMDGILSDIGEATQDINFWERIDYDGRQDWSWNAIWNSAGKVTADGYVAEMSIPFRQLRFPGGTGPQDWGFLATRHYPRNYEYQMRSSVRDFDRNCQVCQFDTLEGLSDLPRGNNLEINPTITSQRTETLTGAGSEDDETDAGLSVRWGITPNISLNATLNPDFSQVEADVARLDVNERFVLFFPETRPFFLDGAEFFSTPLQAVYTRTIADPEAGIKLTGRQGKSSFGVLFAQDRINNLIFPTFQSSRNFSIDQDVSSGVLRYRRNIGKTSNLAFLYTGREADDYHNHVLGVDGRFQIGKSGNLRFQYLRSDTMYPDDVAQANDQPLGAFESDAWELRYDYQTRNWLGIARWRVLGKDFRADHGFFRRADSDEKTLVLVRSWFGKPDAWYSRLAVQFDHGEFETEEGFRFDESNNITFIYEGPRQTSIQWAFRDNFETFQGQSFDNPRTDLFFAMRPTRNTELEVLLRGGKIIDVVNVRQADFVTFQTQFNFRLGRGFTAELSHLLQELSVDEGTFLIANVSETRLIYHFNHRAFIRAIVQYTDVERIPRLHNNPAGTEPNLQTALTQGLFSYKLNAKTVLFLGYSDNYFGTARGFEFDRTNRAFFLKLGYAWLR